MGEKTGGGNSSGDKHIMYYSPSSLYENILSSSKFLKFDNIKRPGENKSKSTDRRCPKYNDKAVPLAKLNDEIRDSASKLFNNPSVVPSTVSV